jgi:inosine/xanthosine triphosphate pyrophosphatase family protein
MNFGKYSKYFKTEKKDVEKKKEGIEKQLSNEELRDISFRVRKSLYTSGFIGIYSRRL